MFKCDRCRHTSTGSLSPIDESMVCFKGTSLQSRHNECDGVSNHRRLDCLLNRLFRRRSKKTSKLSVTGLCEGNPPVTDGFPSQRASNAAMFPFDDVIMNYGISHPKASGEARWKSYRKLSNIRRTKSQNLNDSRLVLHLSLRNLLKPGVE